MTMLIRAFLLLISSSVMYYLYGGPGGELPPASAALFLQLHTTITDIYYQCLMTLAMIKPQVTT